MDIASVSSGAQTAGTTSSKSSISSDFDTFLTLLTAQIQNQDPLNPTDATQYSTQLATFSNVEQQVLTNDLLEAISGQLNVQGLGQLASWVGMEARTSAPVQFDGSPMTLHPRVPNVADSAVLVVTGPNGEEVQRLEIDPKALDFTWSGVTDGGVTVPNGVYGFHVESSVGGQVLTPTPVEHYGRVIEAMQENGQTVLVFAGDVRVGSNDVQSLREPL